MTADMRRHALCQIDIPASLGAKRADISESLVRRYMAQKHDKTLPGDIDIDITEYAPGAFKVVVMENPNLGS